MQGVANRVCRVRFAGPIEVRIDVSPATLQFSHVDEKKSPDGTFVSIIGGLGQINFFLMLKLKLRN